VIVQLQECRFIEIFGGNASDKDSRSLNGQCMPRSDEMLLTRCDEMSHLALDIIPNPNFDQVSSILFAKTRSLLVKNQTRIIWAA
jgi:hypothetical protein